MKKRWCSNAGNNSWRKVSYLIPATPLDSSRKQHSLAIIINIIIWINYWLFLSIFGLTHLPLLSIFSVPPYILKLEPKLNFKLWTILCRSLDYRFIPNHAENSSFWVLILEIIIMVVLKLPVAFKFKTITPPWLLSCGGSHVQEERGEGNDKIEDTSRWYALYWVEET